MKVAIFVYDKLCPFEFGCATELFSLPRPEFNSWYETNIVTFKNHSPQVPYGLSFNSKQVSNFDKFDTVIIPGWSSEIMELDDSVIKALQRFHKQGKRLVSFCSGAFMLAQAGLLTFKQATTHWRYADEFKSRFPQANFANDVLFTFNDNIACSAGSAAALDLGLEIIRQDFGALIANKVARRLVISAHRQGGQAQYVETPVATRHESFTEVIDWAILNLHQGLTVERLAEKANMTRRTFDRQFHKKMGMTAKSWLIQQQLHIAKGLLETRQTSIDEIALKTGFGSALNLRHHFSKTLGITPTKYRNQFNAEDSAA